MDTTPSASSSPSSSSVPPSDPAETFKISNQMELEAKEALLSDLDAEIELVTEKIHDDSSRGPETTASSKPDGSAVVKDDDFHQVMMRMTKSAWDRTHDAPESRSPHRRVAPSAPSNLRERFSSSTSRHEETQRLLTESSLETDSLVGQQAAMDQMVQSRAQAYREVYTQLQVLESDSVGVPTGPSETDGEEENEQ
ncbi:hypothetical protein L202_05112 [Cryptococcus amylolentus CBS 6039]|uniref:Uncharacterized protein n=2 Tax=Cryptococcus amylolentus TaxID=104669 RepID=A0A1E3HNV9_9TREE|nr:hypothetical protein L202_05112 [Cryptococcus amylolentus CBS 6039]ODN78028.1 hypothetical protein L202_05112 [Cryptococcus amylolentus CBS 6039]ODO05975.1 hypothetical protein I350_05036 [Cryptococcus amylolentus CBS 6273]